MRSLFVISAAIFAASAAPAVQAAPMTYGCDTAAGRFSAIEVNVPSAGFVVSGTITPNEYRKDPKWGPTVYVRIDSADDQNGAQVRFSGDPKAKDGIIVLSGIAAGAERKGDPQLAMIGQPFDFRIQVVSASEVLVMAGGRKATLPAALGDKAKLTIGCSTGDFVFSNLDWKNAP